MENFEEFFMQFIIDKSILNIDDVEDILRLKKIPIEHVRYLENDVARIIDMLCGEVYGRENIIPLINRSLIEKDILPYGNLKQIYTRFVNMSTSDLRKYYINFSKNNEIKKIISNDLEKNDFNKVKYRKANIIDEIFKEIFKLKKKDAINRIIKVFYIMDGNSKRFSKLYFYEYNYLYSIDMIINSLHKKTIESKNYTSINIKTFLEDKVKALSERINSEIKYSFSGLDGIRINKYDALTSLELVLDDAGKIVGTGHVFHSEHYITVYVKRLKLNNIKIIFIV